MKYYFYIIYSLSLDNYYIGHTADIHGRIRRHNSNPKGFTGKANDWKLVYSEQYDDKKSAYARERKVKFWKSRTMIAKLIGRNGSGHPDFTSGGHRFESYNSHKEETLKN